MKCAGPKISASLMILLGASHLFAQCGSAELAKIRELSLSFQKNVTMFDSSTSEQLEDLRHLATDCTKAIAAKADRAGVQNMADLPKDDLILLYWVSVMDDTAGTLLRLRDVQKRQGPTGRAETELPGAGPCTKFPKRYITLEERLAWFYGCMREDPPSVAAIKAKIAALPTEKRKDLEKKDFVLQEALIGVASYDLPIQVFPE